MAHLQDTSVFETLATEIKAEEKQKRDTAHMRLSLQAFMDEDRRKKKTDSCTDEGKDKDKGR